MFIATSLAMIGSYYVYDSIGPVAELLASQLGFSDTQLGTLNAIYSVPNLVMVLIGGVLVDRYSARIMTLITTLVCLAGALATALGEHFPVMVLGRLLFGLGAETMSVAVTVGFAQWFTGRHFALLLALNISVSRMGSYLADRSPSFARELYSQGWQPPLWLAVGFAAISVLGGILYWWVDRREAGRGTLALAQPSDHIDWRNLLRFPAQYWYVVALCVTFYAVIFPFRSTFAIKYLQHAHGLSLEAASTMNSYVFLAAVFITPVFGLMLDRFGHQALLLAIGTLALPLSFITLGGSNTGLWAATVLLGVSFSLVPAVLWPAVARYVAADQLGTAYGLMTVLQQAGLVVANFAIGYANDASGASAANPAGYDAMLWLFGVLSLASFVFAALLVRQERVSRHEIRRDDITRSLP